MLASQKDILSQITPVLMSGGAGTRLWPLSRAAKPKQFIELAGHKSLFRQSLERVSPQFGFKAPVLVGNEAHRFLMAEEARLSAVEPQAIFLEPYAKNTAPVAALAGLFLSAISPKGLVLLMPSDHVIHDVKAFHEAVVLAAEGALKGEICCFGITPDKPETGYGYIEQGDMIEGCDQVYKVARFVEKPDLKTAEAYLKSGRYSWNSGIFLFRADVIVSLFEHYAPQLIAGVKAAAAQQCDDLDFIRLDEKAFAGLADISFDYAIMEKIENAAFVPTRMGWSDLGSYSGLWEAGDKDVAGNVVTGDVILRASTGNYIVSNGHLVAGIGLDEMIVVVTDDAVLVAPRAMDQEVKKLVGDLKTMTRLEADQHHTVYRPWGSYRSLAIGERYQVKELMVYPGKRLSLQMHYHRAEHWVIVEGTARVTRDDDLVLLSENQSIYLPLGARHRLENPGTVPLRLIEVQSGSYLGEDDIVRFEDDFNRHKEA